MKRSDLTGSSFEDFLEEEGILESVTATTVKRVIAQHLVEGMKYRGLTKKAMAERMNTSRSQLDRLLDPDNPSVNLQTILRAARVLGKAVRFDLVDAA